MAKCTKQSRRMTRSVGVARHAYPIGAIGSDRASCEHPGPGAEITSSHPGGDLCCAAARQGALQRCRPPRVMRAATADPLPIWFAALIACECRALANDTVHPVLWRGVNNRAIYTNSSTQTERIEPLGILVESGQTVELSWPNGATSYAVEAHWEGRPACG